MHYATSCNTQSSALEDGRDHRPKHVELIGIINKPLLLICLVFISFMSVTHGQTNVKDEYLSEDRAQAASLFKIIRHLIRRMYAPGRTHVNE